MTSQGLILALALESLPAVLGQTQASCMLGKCFTCVLSLQSLQMLFLRRVHQREALSGGDNMKHRLSWHSHSLK